MTSSGRVNGGWRRMAAGCLAVVGLITGLLGLAPSAAAGPLDAESGDTVSVSGYDWARPNSEARVIAGTPENNLVIRYVATSTLSDATVTLDLPRDDWPDPLAWWGWGLDYTSPGGSVVVRPGPEWGDTPGGCRAAPITGTVTHLPSVQRITVEHVSCEPGEQIAVRIFRIAAPRTPGVYLLSLSVSHATVGEASLLPLRVVRQPRTKLAVSMPRVVHYGEPVTVVVRALRPDGRIDRSYRGGVRLISADGPECLFDGSVGKEVYDFTAADAGEHRFTFDFIGRTDRIAAEDVGREARRGRSARFQIEGFPEQIVCPISFH